MYHTCMQHSGLLGLRTWAWSYETKSGCAWVAGTWLTLQMRMCLRLRNCPQPSVPLPQFSWDEHCCLDTQLIRWVPYRMLASYRILLYAMNWAPRNIQASAGKASTICSAFSLLGRNVWDGQVCAGWDVQRYPPSLRSDACSQTVELQHRWWTTKVDGGESNLRFVATAC